MLLYSFKRRAIFYHRDIKRLNFVFVLLITLLTLVIFSLLKYLFSFIQSKIGEGFCLRILAFCDRSQGNLPTDKK